MRGDIWAGSGGMNRTPPGGWVACGKRCARKRHKGRKIRLCWQHFKMSLWLKHWVGGRKWKEKSWNIRTEWVFHVFLRTWTLSLTWRDILRENPLKSWKQDSKHEFHCSNKYYSRSLAFELKRDNYLEDLLKHRWLGPTSSFWFRSSRVEPKKSCF